MIVRHCQSDGMFASQCAENLVHLLAEMCKIYGAFCSFAATYNTVSMRLFAFVLLCWLNSRLSVPGTEIVTVWQMAPLQA